ncbi:MAG: ATP-dependent zinc metalloprotease FtsH [Candidatus Hydrothermales bacterium]
MNERNSKENKVLSFSTLVTWTLIFLVVILFLVYYAEKNLKILNLTYSEFIQEVEKGNIKSVIVSEREIHGEFKTPRVVKGIPYSEFKIALPMQKPDILDFLVKKNVIVETRVRSSLVDFLLGYLPWFLLLVGLWFLFFRQIQAGNSRAFSFVKVRAKLITDKKPNVTFNDVAGCEEAKEELKEIVEFLKNPQKFQKLGAKIPKGILIVGAPGTGKTLLAKAVAGEAGVPFLSISGSDFVELFVGVGAARVRDLFEQARKNAPCIIFIDEIDAVGRLRGAGLGGGHDEREQTLNQILVEMDGFDTREGIIVMAATNRPDILDPALLRPGRFDRRIVLPIPDVKGREEIIKIHARNKPIGEDVDFSVIAKGTPGFSGADLANLVNEAALLAARKGKEKITMEDFEEAKDKILMGVARKSMVLTPKEREQVAYHESGHAILSLLLPHADPIHKVTIIPRGQALGVTQQLPKDDRHIYSKEYLMDQLTVLMGGRVAEKLIFKSISTGAAANDIETATQIARKMVGEWGMSERIGPVSFGKQEEEVFLGRELGLKRNISEKISELIDEEVKRIIEEAEKRAENLLSGKIDALHRLAKALLEKEILDAEEIKKIVLEN